MLAGIANRLWIGTQSLGARRFADALAQPRRAQIEILRRYVERNELTQFGRRHRFSDIRSPLDYQSRVPLSDYADYTESLELIRAGESDVLTADRVKRLEPTSGTSHAHKLIPYTAGLQAELRRAVGPWLTDIARMLPDVRNGPSYWSVSPALPHIDASGEVPIGFDSDRDYLGGWFGWLTGKALLDCDDLRGISDIDAFRHATLLRLLAARDLRLMSVWHPTFLTLLLDHLIAHWPALLDDLATGSRWQQPQPARATELRAADPHRPATLWPKLSLISAWGDGHAAAPARELQARFTNTLVQHKGLLATEGVVSIPWRERTPLAVRSHFFEFLDAQGTARFAWELEQDATYTVVITTGGGLYRYRLDDQVVVTGFVDATPDIRFVGRTGTISDLRGEKLSEAFVAAALGVLLPTHAPAARFALLSAFRTEHSAPQYRLYIDDAGPDDWSAALEQALSQNPHYANCVWLGQLQRAVIVEVGADATARYLDRLRAAGQRLGDIKPAALSTLGDWEETFGLRN